MHHEVERSLATLILSGVLERHPALRVGTVEHELAWIPFFLDQMDYTYTDRPVRGAWHRFADPDARPSDFFRRQCFASFQEDAIGIRLRDVIGPDVLMWGSDYPHTESTFPRSQSILDALLDGVDVGLMPSIWEEAFGYAGVELLAKGIPLIANPLGGIVEYAREGETAWLNHPCTGEGLAEVMLRLIEEPDRIVELHRQVVALRSELVTPMETHVENIERLYREIA
jgi:glycosyltransferase involved in cell wall biosynthesis